MSLITKQVLHDLKPCADRWTNYLKFYSDWQGTPLEFLKLENISANDKIWTLLRKDFIPEKDLHELACKFAESVLPMVEDKRPGDLWGGEIGNDELAAARAAARAARAAEAMWEAMWAAARAAGAMWAAARAAGATWAAAWEAAGAAAGKAARDAEEQKQVQILIEYFEEQEK